ncbi:hypothetical protein R3P38DRAFT_2947349 [Favolaschia claudopus]|uniref:RING-type domain-containing protein n=1 Tax=Favolaschia claudopus TaxID=2862362 RepID=A0AAW0BJ64_9AGAR
MRPAKPKPKPTPKKKTKALPTGQTQLTSTLQLVRSSSSQTRMARYLRSTTTTGRAGPSSSLSSNLSSSSNLSPRSPKFKYTNAVFVNGVSPDDVNIDRTLPTDSEFICSICQNLLTNPVAIPCLPSKAHTFCYHCLRQWLDTSKDCPLCRTHISAPPTHVADLATALATIYPKKQVNTEVLWARAWVGVNFEKK